MSGPDRTLQTMLAVVDVSDMLDALGTLNEMASRQGKTINGAQTQAQRLQDQRGADHGLVDEGKGAGRNRWPRRRSRSRRSSSVLQKLQDESAAAAAAAAATAVATSAAVPTRRPN